LTYGDYQRSRFQSSANEDKCGVQFKRIPSKGHYRRSRFNRHLPNRYEYRVILNEKVTESMSLEVKITEIHTYKLDYKQA